MESVARNPDAPLGRLASRLLGGNVSVEPTQVPDSPIRLYIAPTNYSGQAYAWARAVEAADERIAARNLAVELPGGFRFPADTVVPIATVNASTSWADAEWNAAKQFTHVLVEAERSMFGRRFGREVAAEITAMHAAGVSVAYLCHGTDIRDPDAHARRTSWSPYPEDPRTETLRADAAKNLALLRSLPLPTFVSTPDLLDDVPWAKWCPVVVDPTRFAVEHQPFGDGTPIVMHASSSAVQKGSHLIEDSLAPLIVSEQIDYRLVTGVAATDMPGIYAAADIVLDQFRLGSYGVAACEAMAAGRVVIGHVLPSVRDRIHKITGMELPILEATPDTLLDVITEVVQKPASATAIAATGPAYVRAVHSGAASARTLIADWISPSEDQSSEV
ncbi:glycosyltransferase [Microbacterium sp. AGC85]